ncbi:MAG: DUF4410 domain-containing protein [bacterium]|nr:DUF4410 domain-containing protein [bacterium]
MKTGPWLLLIPLAIGIVTDAVAHTLGEKKKGSKGRYLETADGVRLADYSGALVILEPAEILSDKDRPVDTESVRATSDASLRQHLASTGLFGRIISVAPPELPVGVAVVRVATRLTLQHGSQAMRFWAGGGAGKSKLHIHIGLSDARSGDRIGYFNGYGTGTGIWSISGGGVQRMARDDLEENYAKLGEYLAYAAK